MGILCLRLPSEIGERLEEAITLRTLLWARSDGARIGDALHRFPHRAASAPEGEAEDEETANITADCFGFVSLFGGAVASSALPPRVGTGILDELTRQSASDPHLTLARAFQASVRASSLEKRLGFGARPSDATAAVGASEGEIDPLRFQGAWQQRRHPRRRRSYSAARPPFHGL